MPKRPGEPQADFMERRMHDFKHHEMHAGTGVKGQKQKAPVKDREQAIAIALNESGKGRRPGADGPDPTGRSVAAADVALPHSSMGSLRDRTFHNVAPDNLKQNKPHIVPKAGEPYEPPMARAPAKHGPAPAPLPATKSHGYGHDAVQRQGHLRTSGDSRAHRIGQR